ncbi:MAG TPA: NAD-dependent epimerase/dehydratase family protein, partial [Dermatophilaceae bacterium]|nr:NAD-dependent epimerase/dehydratase family protein [Dermatophilaceae bacterium]
NPMIGKVITTAEVDTVVHLNVIATPTFAGGRTPQKEINVIGTMQLLAACQKAPTVRRLVVKSSAAVYGSTPRDPAMFTEEMTAKRLPRSGFGKDSIEVEGYVRGYARRRPDTDILTLRFANIVGPRIRTSITDYFALPVVPVPLGFDARLQFMHEDDAVEAMVQAVTGEAKGVVNLAGDGVITVLQAAALAGRPVVPVPMQASGVLGALTKRLGLVDFSPDQVSFLAFGRGLDTASMREVLGFEPRFTTRAAFEDFASTLAPPAAAIPGLMTAETAVVGVVGGVVGGVGDLVGAAMGGASGTVSRALGAIGGRL